MTETLSHVQRRLKLAAYLLIAGLAAEGITLQWAHPTSFVVFLTIGAALVMAGIVVYLFAILSH